MASVVNFASKNLITKITSSRYKYLFLRCVSTSMKHKDSASSGSSAGAKTPLTEIPDFSKPLENKNWVSYGFDEENRTNDVVDAHVFMLGLFFVLVFGSFFLAYMPDYEHRNWAKREAFIRLEERELLGLEPIDKNYVDPSRIVLPSDEELGDTEIII